MEGLEQHAILHAVFTILIQMTREKITSFYNALS